MSGGRWLLAAVLATAGGAAAADPPRDVTVTDRAHHAISALYVSPSTSEDWGDDRLGDVVLRPGQSRRLRLEDLPGCAVDLRVVYDDATREERHGVDLCRTRQVAFDGSGVAAADEHAVAIANGSGRPIQQVLISSSDSGDWGDDLLIGGSLSAGDRRMVRYRGDCLADLRVVYDNRSAEERRDLDLCGLHGVVVQPGWTTADRLAPLQDQAVGKAGP